MPRIDVRRWLARMKAWLLAEPAPRRHRPGHRAVKREAFMEDAAMAREMHRL